MNQKKNPIALTRTAARFGLASVALALVSPALAQLPDGSGDVREQLTEIQIQLREVNNQLEGIQNEAIQEPRVEEALLAYGDTLTEEMIKIEPEETRAIERRHNLFDELITTEQSETISEEQSQRFQELRMEYNQLRQELAPIETRASQTPGVREAITQYNEALTRTMMEIDGSAEELLRRQQALQQEFARLQQSLRQNN